MKKTFIRISALLGTLTLALFAMTLSGSARPTTASAEATDATVIDVHAVDQAYSPAIIKAPANAPFTLHLINDDTFDNEHDIRVKDGSGATIAKTPGTCFGPCDLSVSVPALSPGVYSIYCIVHDDMNGELDVN